ncbi:MAG: 7-carboxy-7-deazaguanine synthase [Gemmatimonadales bacterium]
MPYAVKEIYYTLQGEGAQTGRPAVFCRFAGCNLWTGREEDRATAVCRFCDTDFFGVNGVEGGKYPTAEALAAKVAEVWDGGDPERREVRQSALEDVPEFTDRPARLPAYVVCTGGEPLLQLDATLVSAFHATGFEVAVETNGTQEPPAGLDWICVSPKAEAPLVLRRGDELKLVFPQQGAEPGRFAALPFRHFFLQPMDGPARAENTQRAAEYCLAHPRWRLSLQTHKLIGLP